MRTVAGSIWARAALGNCVRVSVAHLAAAGAVFGDFCCLLRRGYGFIIAFELLPVRSVS